jgi:adenylate kinase
MEIPQISTGDILRSAVKSGTPMGLKAQSFMESGGLVPDEVVIGIVQERLEESDCLRGFILDGFPRTVAQAESLRDMLAANGRRIDRVVCIDIPHADLVDRMVGRRICSSCGRGYHVKYDPSKLEGLCDGCGSKLIQRADDVYETVAKRLDVYEQQTRPLIEYYSGAGNLHVLSGVGSVEEIQQRIVAVVAAIR